MPQDSGWLGRKLSNIGPGVIKFFARKYLRKTNPSSRSAKADEISKAQPASQTSANTCMTKNAVQQHKNYHSLLTW